MIKVVLFCGVVLFILRGISGNLRYQYQQFQQQQQQQQQQQNAVQSTLPEPVFDSTVCRTIPGMSKAQQLLCYQHPDITVVALEGLHQAMQECQYQFQGHRWNCSNLATKRNPYTSTILQKGYRETAFAYALSAAGTTISVARACSQGRLKNCNCGHRNYRAKLPDDDFGDGSDERQKISWKWGGCSHNLQYGLKFSKTFLDNRDRASDLQSNVNTHNNQVGRMAVSNNMEIKCKCHGLSGSCELRTCWRTTPSIRKVGAVLKDNFRSAVLVDQSNVGNENPNTFTIVKSTRKKRLKSRGKNKEWVITKNKSRKGKKRDLASNLLYYQRSPNFCERDANLDVTGTMGRQCYKNSTGPDNCSSLCCGRGHSEVRRRRKEKCFCEFIYCCEVKCKTCEVEEYINVCN